MTANISAKYPQAIQIEPYGGCNIRCSMCFRGKMRLPADKDLLDMDLYRRIIDEVSPYTSRLYLFWRGEPLLHPNLGEMIAYARTAGLYVFISTNAVLLDEQRAKEFIDVGLDFLVVGFDGATKKSFEGMRRGAKFERVLANVQKLIDLKNAQKALLPHVSLQLIVSSLNYHELKRFHKLGNEIGVYSTIEKMLDVYANLKNEKIDVALSELHVEGEWSKYEGDGTALSTKISITECDMVRRLVVRADGELNLCCYDFQGQYQIESARDDAIMDVWQRPDYRQLRGQGRRRETSLCENCGVGLQR